MAESKYINQQLRIGRDSILSIVNLLNHVIEDLRTGVVTAAQTVLNLTDDDEYSGYTEGNVNLKGEITVEKATVGFSGATTAIIQTGADELVIGDTSHKTRIEGKNNLVSVNGALIGAGSALPAEIEGGIYLLLEDASPNTKGLYFCASVSDGWTRS